MRAGWFHRLRRTNLLEGSLSCSRFNERSQVTIPRLRRFRNEISFASPRGGGVSRGFAAPSLFISFSYPAAQPVASSSSSSSSNFLFVSFRGEGKPRLGIRHQGVYRKDFVTGRYYSAFSNVRGPPLSPLSNDSLDILFFPRFRFLPLPGSPLNDRPVINATREGRRREGVTRSMKFGSMNESVRRNCDLCSLPPPFVCLPTTSLYFFVRPELQFIFRRGNCPSSSPLPPLPSLSLQHRCRFAHRKNPSFQEEESKIPRNLTFFPWIWNETVWERIKRTGFERLGKRGNRNEDKLETAIWPVICPGIISTNRDN